MFGPSSTKRDIFRSTRPKKTMFLTGSTKRDTFRPAQPKLLCFDQVRLSLTKRETFRPARPKQLGFDQIQPSEIRFDRRDQNIYVSTKFGQAGYVSTGVTKTFMF